MIKAFYQRNKLFFIFCFPFLLISQKKDSIEIARLLKESFEIQYRTNDLAIDMLKKAQQLAVQNKDTVIQSKIHRRLGHCFWFSGNVEEGLKQYRRVLNLNQFRFYSNDTSIKKAALNDIAEALHGIAILYKSEYNSKKAIEYYGYSLPFYTSLGKASALSALYGNRGMTYLDQSDFPKAIEGFYAALKIAEQINDSTLLQNNYGNLGNAYHTIGEIEKAKFYLEKALIIAELRKDSNILFVAYNSYAKLFIKESKDYTGAESEIEEAKNFYLKADMVASGLHQDAFRAFNYSNIASLYVMIKNIDSLTHYFNISNKLAELTQEKQTLAINNFDWGLYVHEKGNLLLAEKLFLNSLRFAEEAELTELIMKIEESLYDLYKTKGNYQLAFSHYEKYITLRDSLFNESNSKKTLQQQLKYEYEKKATADSVKASEEKKVVDAQLKQEKTQRFALYGGLSLVGVFALFMVNRFRVTSQQKKLIEEQKQIVETQKYLVEEKQKEIIDSIKYAKRIQTALMSSEYYVHKNLKKLHPN